jgi:hypothetical protein
MRDPDHPLSVKLAAIHATIKSGTKASKMFRVYVCAVISIDSPIPA